ncbi:MAG: 16S rRNA (guanine(966)-N(2))-methyltransferase RsmD [Pseudobutyrivibrio sp.]|nr:16S rRNA (guanine(966)-N(2))-methyltransferase RsmD [Pseudobutyrivibrio sp.]
MRVISGSRRGLKLDTLEGLVTRPTSDRIKETLFNMIAFELRDSRFLDLFAGSGQMGIEALSRGASFAIFVEKDKNALNVIKKNISKCKFEQSSKVISSDVVLAINSLKSEKEFDIVFMDPPYNKEIEKEVLQALRDLPCISNSTLIIVEASLETDFSYIDDMGYELIKEKVYKTNKHLFLKKA